MNTGNKITAVLTIIVLAGLPLACKPIQDNSAEPAIGALPCGTHTLISIDGHPIPYAPIHDGGQAPEVSGGSLTINSDGTFTCNIKFSDPNITTVAPSGEDKGQPGTYTRDGNTLTLKHPGAGYTPVTIAGDTLTMNNEGMLFVFQKERGAPVAIAAEKQSGTRTPEQVLDQLLGTWSQETTTFKAKWTPEEKRTTQVWTATRTLGKNFVLLMVEDEQKKSDLQLFTYNQKQKCYQLWTFGSIYGGPDVPSNGQWNEATRTIEWSSLGNDGNKSSSQMRFIDEGMTITTVKVKDTAGELLMHMEFKATRLKDPSAQTLSVTESSTPNLGQTPEQKVLDMLLGNWNCEVTLNTLGPNPEKKQFTEKHTMTLILNGSFVQETVENSLGNSVLILYTFDQKKQCYRLWGFSSEQGGFDFWYDGTWNPMSREINWSSQVPGAYSATARQSFVNDTTIEFSWKVMDSTETLLSEGLTKFTRATGAVEASGAIGASGATAASATAAIAPNITPPPNLQNDDALRASCANNLKQLGIVFKMFGNESVVNDFPELSPQAGNLFFSNENGEKKTSVYPEYLTDLRVVVCPATVDADSLSNLDALQAANVLTDESYFYLGYVVTSDAEVKMFAEVYKERITKGLKFDQDLDAPQGSGSWHGNRLYRLRNGIERFGITDINNPAAAAMLQSRTPILIERPGHHKPDGGNILYLDGHVEFINYPGTWPMTEATIGILTELSNSKTSPAE